MKKTKILVMTAVIALTFKTAVYAELPHNANGSLIIGNSVYSIDYIKNNMNLVNQKLADNLDSLFYVDSSGSAKDIFSGSSVSESQIIDRVGKTLVSYDSSGNSIKYIADSSGQYINTNLSDDSTNGSAILDLSYSSLSSSTDMKLITLTVRSVFGVTDASYYKIVDPTSAVDTSNLIPLNSSCTILYSGSYGKQINIYDSNRNQIMVGTFQPTFASGQTTLTLTVQLHQGSSSTPTNTDIGNTKGNISNNGLVAVDADKQWIYYCNTADGNKLYKRSVDGLDDYIISDDNVKYINVSGNWVYYSNYSDGGKIYKVRTDGTDKQKVADDMASCINVIGDKIYYINNSDSSKIYLISSKGKEKVSDDSAAYLNVVGNSIFYSNILAGGKLYKTGGSGTTGRLSEVPATFINAVSETKVYYISSDSKVHTNVNGYDSSIDIISNVPAKGKSSSTTMTPTKDKVSQINVDDLGNIYYKSYVDGGKVYKADIHGNGYKFVDDSGDFSYIADTDTTGSSTSINSGYLYYLKSNSLYRVPITSDGTVKGEAVAKPKSTLKITKVQDIPMFTTDDITRFNFPERVSCMMSDGSIKNLVVNWDKNKVTLKNGIYTYSGTILGYGTKATLQVSISTGMLDIANVQVKNGAGSKDSVIVSNLEAGETVSVYLTSTTTKPITAKVGANGVATITGLTLDPMGGSIYVTHTKTGKAESSKLMVPYQPEAPAGFSVDAENNQITGLKANQTYIGYLYDAAVTDDSKVNWSTSGDGVTKDGNGGVNPIKFNIVVGSDGTVAMKDDSGAAVTFASKVDNAANNGKGLSFRIVKPGSASNTPNSDPSDTVLISRAKVPTYIGIDYSSGTIMGTDTTMEYAYDVGDGTTAPTSSGAWIACKSGSTAVMINSYLETWVRIKAQGPTLSSKPKAFSLFAPPTVTGINDGDTYSDDKEPIPVWNSDSSISAKVIVYDENQDPRTTTPINVNVNTGTSTVSATDLTNYDGKSFAVPNGDGTKVYAFVLTQKRSVNGRIGYGVRVVKFRYNSTKPSTVDIAIKENEGTLYKDNGLDIYYQASPTINNPMGTDVDVRLQKIAKPANYYDNTNTMNPVYTKIINNKWTISKLADSDPTNDDPSSVDDGFRNAELIPVVNGSPVKEEGVYKITAKVRNMETGAITPNVKYFIVDRKGVTPASIHMAKVDNANGTISTTNTTNTNKYTDIGVIGDGATYTSIIPLIVANTNSDTDKNNDVQVTAELSGMTGAYVPITLDSDTNKQYNVGKELNYKGTGTYTLHVVTTNMLNGAQDTTSGVVTFNIDSTSNIPGAPNVTPGLDSSGGITLSGSDSTMQYSLTGQVGWKDINSTNYVIPKSELDNALNVTNGIWVRKKANNGVPASQVQIISVVKDATDNPSNVTFNFDSAGGNGKVDITDNGGNILSDSSLYEYRINSGNWSNFATSSGGTLLPGDADKITSSLEVRKTTYISGSPATVHMMSDVYNVNLVPSTKTAPNVTLATADINTPGGTVILTGGDNTMQYSLDNGVTWTTYSTTTGIGGVKAPNTILVRYKGTGNNLPSGTTTLTVAVGNIGKAAAPVKDTDIKFEQGTNTGTIKITANTTATTYEYVIDGNPAAPLDTSTSWNSPQTIISTTPVDNITVSSGQYIHIRVKAANGLPASKTLDYQLVP